LRVVEEFFAKGHRNVLAAHQMTWEITKDSELSRRGDCVVAVSATKGLTDLSASFRTLCRNDGATITAELSIGNLTEIIRGKGSQHLSLTHPTEIVGRKSTFATDRTIMISADKAACNLNRELVKRLTSPDATLRVRLVAEV
jgi:hypothetical protein